MDPQFAPRMLARRTHLQIVDSIAAVANDTNVAVFQRDGLHMNNVSYSCIAHLLAGSLVEAVEPGLARVSDHRSPRQ
jgi:hypothetical protein